MTALLASYIFIKDNEVNTKNLDGVEIKMKVYFSLPTHYHKHINNIKIALPLYFMYK